MNPVVHFEIPFDDEQRARAFYENAFGWNISDWPIEDGTNYIGVMTGEVDENNQHIEKNVIGGGMVPRSLIEVPVLVLKCEDIESDAKKAVEAGAQRVKEVTYPSVGTAIYLKDTEGNLVALWQSVQKSTG